MYCSLLLLLMATGSGLGAQIPSGYYNNANGKTGDELKTALHDIITGHTTINYSQIWNAFWSTDNKGNGVVWDMYSDIPNGTPPYTFSIGQNQCGEYVQEGDCYNREHSWPQSWFGGDDQATPSRDLHHVFPTDGFVNAQRSNYPFGEVNTASWTSQNGSKLGTCKSSLGYVGIVFEPIDEYKGDFARAMMYMSVRYYTEDDNWGTSGMTNKSEILPWAIQMLLDWNDNDPVSQKEIDRNNVIYSDYQHNRNPFIDHPEYARMIWDPNWHGGGGVGAGDYVKVTTEPTDWSGDYLIVYENSGKAFNGALSTLDANNNTISVTISNNQIGSSDETDAAIFTIAPMTGGYSIKSASGKYIGYSATSNGLTASPTALLNTISLSNGSIIIKGTGTSTLQYNSNADRFRYYGSTQNAIQLYKKAETYSITLATVEHGSISANAEEASEGSTITLTATPDEGYELDYWTVTTAGGDYVTVTDNQFAMPASNVMVSAVFSAAFSQQYHLVTDANQLIAGRTYLIVNTQYGKALGKTQNINNRSAASVGVDDNVIASIGDAVCELVLGGQAGAWTFKDGNVGYLYAAGGGNYLRTQSVLTNNGKWAISITNGMASIVSNGDVSQKTIRFNPATNNPIFSCYASGQKDICLFIRSEQYEHTENESIAQMFPFDKHVVRSGATLTVIGEANCSAPNHLILEDGAQFIHNAGTVNATMRKNIEGYVADGGWYTLAFPMANPDLAQTNILTANYDLYAYNEAAALEWVNQKAHQDDFDFNSGSGYLYAHNPSFVVHVSGTLNSGNYTETVDLSYGNSLANMRGFNLLGNPTAHDIGFTKSGSVSDGYYYLNNSNAWVYETGNTVPVGRGFLVKANAENQTVTLNPQNRGESRENGQYLCLSIGEEKAYVKLDEGVSMPLVDFKGQHASFYLTQGHERFAMLVRDGAEALDLSFEARQSGTFTLSADTQGLDLDYLHLIDNLTGANVDLLTPPAFGHPLSEGEAQSGAELGSDRPATDSRTPAGVPPLRGGQGESKTPAGVPPLQRGQGGFNYTFTAKTTDYASRFRLVFSNDDAGEDACEPPFAYISNGNIVITADAGDATLQIVDMMGRVIASYGGHTRYVTTNGMLAGVYVLRLINGDKVRVQKIVIE